MKIKYAFLLITATMCSGCSNNDPKKEDTPELITKAILTFTPPGGAAIVATATDPDGEGVKNIVVDGPVNLGKTKTYLLEIQLINGLVAQGQPGYDVTNEVAEEGIEHQFFFSWTNGVFSDPAGDGNIDNASDPLNYSGGAYSKDANGRNLGITTAWNTTGVNLSGSFRILLKHQPGLKSATSNANIGETDLDLTFTINVQ